MRWIKLLMTTIVIFTSLLVLGEGRMLSLDSFYEQFDTTTIYINPEISEKEMIDDIYKAADKHNVEVFTIVETPNGTLSNIKTIYGTNGVEKLLREKIDLQAGSYDSIFLGDLTFRFKELRDHSSIAYTPEFYGIGNPDAVHFFKMELIDTYGGNHPQSGYNEDAERNRVLGIWVLVTVITLLLTFYGIAMQRKETLIRLSMGESLRIIILRLITIDSIIIIFAFLCSFFILREFTQIQSYLSLLIPLVGALLVINVFAYLTMGLMTVREAFSNGAQSRKLLTMTYSLKFITSILTIALISSSLTVAFEAMELYKQRDFFEKRKDYYYTYIGHKVTSPNFSALESPEVSEKIQTNMYNTFIDQFQATLITPVNNLSDREQTTLLVNHNALSYVEEQMPKLQDKIENQEFAILVPEGKKAPDELLLRDSFQSLGIDNLIPNSYEIIEYEESVEFVAVEQNNINGSLLVDNPTLLVINTNVDRQGQLAMNNQMSQVLLSDVMYRLDGTLFNQFVKEQGMKDELVLETNVWDKYLFVWNSAKRLMIMNLVFAALVLSLELLIIGTILRLEYQVNAIELSIKKVMGYSILAKNRLLVVLTLVITLFSIVASSVVSYFVKFGEPTLLIVGGGCLLILELFVIGLSIRRIERVNIQRILKGGNI